MNIEGGLLVLGITSNGLVNGIDHLSENEINSLTDISKLLVCQAAVVSMHHCEDSSGNPKTICLIFTPYIENGICETPGQNPQAWIRNGPQNILMTQERRDHIRNIKGLLNFENMACCKFNKDDLAEDILIEFRKVFHPDSTKEFSDERLLYEAGAIVEYKGEQWFTHAGLLFFATNPQRIIPEAHIRLTRFGVSVKQYQERGLPTFDQSFTGSITHLS